MSYTANKGSMLAKVKMLNASHWPQVGTSPVATLQDPVSGNEYFMGFNPPSVIPGCMLLLDFESPDGFTTIYDRSEFGKSYAGTSIDTSKFQPTIFGTAYDFQAGDYFQSPNNTDLDIGTFTIEAVVQFDNLAANSRIASKAEGAGWAFGSYIDNVDGIRFFYHDGATYQKIVIPSSMVDTIHWWHVAASVEEGGEAKIYLNGKLIDSASVGTYTHQTNWPGIIGAECGNPTNYNHAGRIATIRMCDRVLKPHEFMYHWYFNSLVDGEFQSDGSLLFDENVCAFEPGKIFTVQADWDSMYDLQQSNIIIDNIRGLPDEGFVASDYDFSILHAGKNAQIDDDTLACWFFDERMNSEGKCPDATGNGFDLNIIDLYGHTVQPARYGTAWYFDGDGNDYFQLDSTTAKAFRVQEFTIEALVHAYDLASSHSIFTYDYTSHSDPYYSIHLRLDTSTTNKASFLWNDGATYKNISAPNNTSMPGVTHHIACTFRSGEQKLYVNGVVLDSDTLANTISWYDTPITIGRSMNYGAYARGFIHYVRFTPRVRTQDEIIRNAQSFSRLNGSIQDLFLPS